MTYSRLLIWLPLWVLLNLCFGACQRSADWDRESARLEQYNLALDQQYAYLNFAIDSLWDTTTAILARTMPAGIPPVDREIFLTSRNANHIRMFDSFRAFPDSIRALVDHAACEDEKLAATLTRLAEQRAQFEKEKMKFLSEVARHHPDQYKSYAIRLNGKLPDHEF